jgi:S-adenosylmethionine/arginine decarboxylase-like enzyme
MTASSSFWGYHLMVDCGELGVSAEALNDVERIKAFMRELLDVAGMRAWGEPVLARLTPEDGEFPDGLSGYTCVQLLHTSNACLHLCDLTKKLFFDLFSCKAFDQAAVVGVVEKYFAPGRTRVNFLTREP